MASNIDRWHSNAAWVSGPFFFFFSLLSVALLLTSSAQSSPLAGRVSSAGTAQLPGWFVPDENAAWMKWKCATNTFCLRAAGHRQSGAHRCRGSKLHQCPLRFSGFRLKWVIIRNQTQHCLQNWTGVTRSSNTLPLCESCSQQTSRSLATFLYVMLECLLCVAVGCTCSAAVWSLTALWWMLSLLGVAAMWQLLLPSNCPSYSPQYESPSPSDLLLFSVLPLTEFISILKTFI